MKMLGCFCGSRYLLASTVLTSMELHMVQRIGLQRESENLPKRVQSRTECCLMDGWMEERIEITLSKSRAKRMRRGEPLECSVMPYITRLYLRSPE